MKNLIAYMDVLSESINLLQLPFKGYSSHILFGDFFLKVKMIYQRIYQQSIKRYKS